MNERYYWLPIALFGGLTGYEGGLAGAFICGVACLGVMGDWFKAHSLRQEVTALKATNLAMMGEIADQSRLTLDEARIRVLAHLVACGIDIADAEPVFRVQGELIEWKMVGGDPWSYVEEDGNVIDWRGLHDECPACGGVGHDPFDVDAPCFKCQSTSGDLEK